MVIILWFNHIKNFFLYFIIIMNIILIILIVISIILLYEISISYKRKLNRRKLFKLAKERAKLTNKKLLVIGDPYNGIASITTGADYDCGDLCADINGCPKCPNKIKIRLEDLVDKDLSNYVIFISCVLEYVDDIQKITNKLNKLNFDDVFIVPVEAYSLMAYFYPYFLTNEQPAKNIITSTKPIKFKKVITI